MIIDFKKEKTGPLSLPVPLKAPVTKRTGVNAGRETGHIRVKNVVLLPGINQVDDDTWNLVRDLSKVQYYISQGLIVEKYADIQKDEKEKTIAVKTVKEFSEISLEEKETLIKDTWDLALLNKWRKGADAAVVTAIDLQVNLIKTPPGENADKKPNGDSDSSKTE